MVKLVAVTPSASVHETVREVVNEALRDTARGPVEEYIISRCHNRELLLAFPALKQKLIQTKAD